MEYVESIGSGELPPPPIAVVMNMAMVELSDGKAVFEGDPGEEHYNPIGVVHGGYASTLLDSALGCAVHTTLDAGFAYTSLTLEAKFVRPITRDTGRVRRRPRSSTAGAPRRPRRRAWLPPRLASSSPPAPAPA